MAAEVLVLEVVRQLLTAAFTYAETNGVTEEELKTIRKASYEEVKKRKASDLPDV